MEIVKIKNKMFGNKKMAVVVTGWCLYETGKGYIAFSACRDKFDILAPYIPRGGKKALQSILDSGGFDSLEGIEYVNALN